MSVSALDMIYSGDWLFFALVLCNVVGIGVKCALIRVTEVTSSAGSESLDRNLFSSLSTL